MILWLLEKSVLDQMQKAESAGIIPSPEQLQQFEALTAADGELPRIMSIVGSQAGIQITGVLTDAPNWFARWFGGGNTTYAEIQQAIALAESDPKIKEIVLAINSPGGQASAAWVDTIDIVKGAKKPVRAMVGNMAASAAYGIASQADSIIAQNRMSQVGSVGVVSSHYVNAGIVDVTSSNAPEKRPDVTTDAGKAQVRKVIDQMEAIFIDAIAAGRKKDRETVISNFGQGNIVLAAEAIKRGMIDSILPDNSATQTAAAKGGMQKKEESKMDKQTLKDQHASVYQSVIDEGMEQGVAKERTRVNALLKMGKAHNAMDIAQKAIAEGKTIHDDEVMADFLTAKTNLQDQTSRDADDQAAGNATKETNTKPEANTSKMVVDAVLKKLGV